MSIYHNCAYIKPATTGTTSSSYTLAFAKCLEAGIFNGCGLMEVAESLRIRKGEALIEIRKQREAVPEADVSGMIPEKTDLSTFNAFFI